LQNLFLHIRNIKYTGQLLAGANCIIRRPQQISRWVVTDLAHAAARTCIQGGFEHTTAS